MLGLIHEEDYKPKRVQVKRDPVPQIHAGEERVAFDELIAQGNALARLLNDAGSKEGDFHVLLMDKSPGFLISLFGINKSGGIALPVDPHWPVDRLQTIIFDYAPKWLIVDESVTHMLGSRIFRNGTINVGWMGDREKLPDDICPEFIRDNINVYRDCTDEFQPDRTCLSMVFFEHHSEKELEAYLLNNGEIGCFVRQILKMIRVGENDRVGGFLPGHSLAFMLEAGIAAFCKIPVHLFRPSILKKQSHFLDIIEKNKLTRVLCRSEDLRFLTYGHLDTNLACESVEEVTLWGPIPSRGRLYLLRKLFPNCTVQNFYRFSNKKKSKQESRVSTDHSSGFSTGFKEEPVYILSKEHFSSTSRHFSLLPDINEVYRADWKKKSINGNSA